MDLPIKRLQVDTRQVRLGLDALRFERSDDGVAIDIRVESRCVDEPRPFLRSLVHGRDAVDLGHVGLVPTGDAIAVGEHVVEPFQLRDADRRMNIGEPVVEAQARMHQPGAVVRAPLVDQALQMPGKVAVVGQDDPAFGRCHLLVGVEREDRRVPERAIRPSVVVATDRLAGVLDDGQPVTVGDVNQRRQLGRVAEDVDDLDGLGARRDRGLDRGRVHIERLGIDLDEHRRRAGEQNRVGRRHKRERWHDDLVPRTQAQRVETRVQAGGAAGAGHGVGDSRAFGPVMLEPGQHRTQRQLPRPQHLLYELHLTVADDRLGKRDDVERGVRHAVRARARAARRAPCSRLSTSACHDASIRFSLTPIVPHVSS